MRYQRTQISLTPEHHQKLVDEAAERGISLAELVRQVLHHHLAKRGGAPKTKSFDAITGIVALDEPSDIVRDWDKLMGEAMDDLYKRKMGLPDESPPKRRPPRRAKG